MEKLEPAAMPATCVPWKQAPTPAQVLGEAAPLPTMLSCPFGHSVVDPNALYVVEKQASELTRPPKKL